MDLIILLIILILIYAYVTLDNKYGKCIPNPKKGNIRNMFGEKINIFKNKQSKLDIENAKQLLKQNAFDQIIDIRRDRAWIMGHHPDAIHITINRLESILPDKIINKNNKILIYGENAQEAKEASIIVKSLGYKNVKYIDKKYESLF
jgi:rhodanese-related sulfurtransferase